MDVAKILKGLFVRDGQSGIQRQIDSKVNPVLAAALRSTAGGNEITALSTTIDKIGNNRLLVGESSLEAKYAYGTADIHLAAADSNSPTIQTVPVGERWRIWKVIKGVSVAASAIYVTPINTNIGVPFIDLTASATALTQGTQYGWIAEAGTNFFMHADANAGDTAITWAIQYEKV